MGLTWCPASVDFQVRAFALQAAGIQCSLAAVPDPPPQVVSETRSQISEVCSRLTALGRAWACRTAAARPATAREPPVIREGSENGGYVNC